MFGLHELGKSDQNWNYQNYLMFTWKLLMVGFQNRLIFLNLAIQFGDIWILVLKKKKRVFFRQALKGSYIRNGTKKKILTGFLQFLGINTHNFVQKDPKFLSKSLCKILWSLTWKKFSDLKALICEVRGWKSRAIWAQSL